MAKEKMKVTEDELLKALNDLEGTAAGDDEDMEEPEVAKAKYKAKKADDEESDDEESGDDEESSMGKSHTEAKPGMPGSTKEANGGFKGQKGASEDPEHFETNADEEDPTGASMKSLVEDSDTLRKGFEVSGFLEALTDAQVEAVDGLRKSQVEFQNEQRAFNAKMQKAIIAMGNMLMTGVQKSEAEGDEPVVVRPRAVLRKSEVAERFEENAGGEELKYNRQQTLDALTDLAVKGEVPALVVSAYESSSFIEPQFHSTVNAKLKAMFG